MDPAVRQKIRNVKAEPRLRGDGPRHYLRRIFTDARTPPTRGWTQRGNLQREHYAQNPAYAGMDPLPGGDQSPVSPEPRLRGDGPRCPTEDPERESRTPPTRGWTSALPSPYFHRCQNPAYAGMDPARKSSKRALRSEPRLRGDGPATGRGSITCIARTPPTRGWTFHMPHHLLVSTQNPAYAGMDLPCEVLKRCRNTEPRLRGDGPTSRRAPRRAVRRTPPTRGWTSSSTGLEKAAIQNPAYAGMDLKSCKEKSNRATEPRLRGDGPS